MRKLIRKFHLIKSKYKEERRSKNKLKPKFFLLLEFLILVELNTCIYLLGINFVFITAPLSVLLFFRYSLNRYDKVLERIHRLEILEEKQSHK